jgi:predicted nucleotidyltransferase
VVAVIETRESIAARRAEILRIAGRYGAHHVRIFGSVARGEARPDSDLDLLIDLEPGRSLFDIIGIKQDLEELLGRRVDVVTIPGLSPYIRDDVLREAIPL